MWVWSTQTEVAKKAVFESFTEGHFFHSENFTQEKGIFLLNHQYRFSCLSSPAYPLIRSLQYEIFKCLHCLVCGELSASFGSSVWQSLLEKCWLQEEGVWITCCHALLLNLYQGSLFSLLNAGFPKQVGHCSVSGLKSLTVCAPVGKTEKLLLPHPNFYLLLCFSVFSTELLCNRMAAINFLACNISGWKYCRCALF